MAEHPEDKVQELISDQIKQAGGISALAGRIAENNASFQREVQSVLGSLQYDGLRDVFTSAGWKAAGTSMKSIAEMAPFYYRRVGTATTLINKPPEWCFRRGFEIRSEDEGFSEEVNSLFNLMLVNDKLFRADKLSRVGRYGVIVLGHEDIIPGDVSTWRKPVQPGIKIISLRPMMEASVQEIKTSASGVVTYSIKNSNLGSKVTVEIDSSRIIHIADNKDDSDFYGTPEIANVLNELDDLIKISGSAGEAFYRYRGTFMLQQRVDNDGQLVGFKDDTSKSEMMDAFRDYFLGLYSTLILSNVEAKQIADEPVSPKEWQDSIYERIAAAKDTPKRLISGSETGERSTTEDLKQYATKNESRQLNHCDPYIVRPTIDAFIFSGLLSEPKKPYTVHWPAILIQTAEEVLKEGEALSKANKEYAATTGEVLFSREEIRMSFGKAPVEVPIV